MKKKGAHCSLMFHFVLIDKCKKRLLKQHNRRPLVCLWKVPHFICSPSPAPKWTCTRFAEVRTRGQKRKQKSHMKEKDLACLLECMGKRWKLLWYKPYRAVSREILSELSGKWSLLSPMSTCNNLCLAIGSVTGVSDSKSCEDCADYVR